MSIPTNAAIVDITQARKWEPFKMQEGGGVLGYVTYTEDKGEIHIPYGTDPVSIMVQSHELSHVRYTSQLWRNAEQAITDMRALAGTTAGIVGYAEDMRITALAGRMDIKTLPSMDDEEDHPIIKRWVESFVAAGIPEDRVNAALKFILTQHTAVLKTLGLTVSQLQQKKNAKRYIVHCAKVLHNLLSKGEKPKDEPTSGKTDKSGKSDKSDKKKSDKKSEPQPATEESEDESEDEESEDENDKSDKSDDSEDGEGEQEGDGGDTGEAEGDAEEAEGDSGSDGDQPGGDTDAKGEIDLSKIKMPDMKASMMESVPAPEDTDKLIQKFQHVLDTTDWVKVPRIERKPLVRRTAIARRRGLKASETGVALRSAYDAVAPNERRPFVGKRKSGVNGLTVLIDCSGSMGITEEQIEHLLTAHPQGVVVTYSTHVSIFGSDEVPGGTAKVAIIASHGRMAAEGDFRNYSAGANACDGPVLQWLSKQSGEKVWVCDGRITKKYDAGVKYDPAGMKAWLKSKKVTRFHSLDDYLLSLSKKG